MRLDLGPVGRGEQYTQKMDTSLENHLVVSLSVKDTQTLRPSRSPLPRPTHEKCVCWPSERHTGMSQLPRQEHRPNVCICPGGRLQWSTFWNTQRWGPTENCSLLTKAEGNQTQEDIL